MGEGDLSVDEILDAAGRFEVRRRLGAGGMGVVYEAYDRKRDVLVALKTLRRLSPASLYLFKQEFRALADVTHPNLVTLYELLVDDTKWFFTMELLEGVDVLAYLREEPPLQAREAAADAGAGKDETKSLAGDSTLSTVELTSSPTTGRTEQAPPADPARLRAVLLQLAEGLHALHASGHLHCDIKPSNVLVDQRGRVVVLDYGVVAEVESRSGEPTRGDFRGTPAYTSPEQAAREPPTPASDWYSVGVILYEGLTGRRPFRGTTTAILEEKQRSDPPPPLVVNPDADADLAALCMRLLSRPPSERPSGEEVLAELGRSQSRAIEALRSGMASLPTRAHTHLVGRERELTSLRHAFDQSRQGTGVAIRIKGRSGMGKTTLAAHFLDDLVERGEALVLAGRCYERENVPHQAVDGLVDALCQHLLQLPRRDAETLMPLDVLVMARAFPVLGRVEAVSKAKRRSTLAVTDPVELRQRAHAALRELFARLAERQPLVLFIDDLQWGDVDSAPFLADLLQPPAPPLMIIVGYRAEDFETSPLLTTLFGAEAAEDSTFANAVEIPVGRLPLPLARSLAVALLEEARASTAPAESIARESGGNPFFVHELVRYVSSQPGDEANKVPPLAEVLLARAEALTEDARELLEVVAVAGKPIPEAVARRAAGARKQHPRTIAELRTAHLVRTTKVDARLMIETYHDRIRESLVRSLSADKLRSLHLQIAESIEAANLTDPEALALHYAAAGERTAGSEFAAIAADKAADALAFDRAAKFYRLAVDLADPYEHERLASLGSRYGDALVNAGRGAEAPEVYLGAAAVAEPQHARDLQVRAGSELLRSGQVEDGMEVLRRPLESAGITLARSKIGAAASLLYRRAYSRVRGLGFKHREPSQIAPETLTRIDAEHAAAAGLAMVDPLRGAYLQTRHLLAALREGDLFRVGRALSYEAGYLCIGGRSTRARVDRIFSTVEEIAAEIRNPYLEAVRHTHTALAEYQCGNWPGTRDHSDISYKKLREECIGSSWEVASVQLYALWALFWLGEFKELSERVGAARRDARARGDLYASVCYDTGLPSFAGLVADDVATTRMRAEEAARQWSQSDYHLQHYWAAASLAQCDLYGGDPIAASKRLEEQWPRLKSAFLLRVAMVRAEMLFFRARGALAAARVADERDRYLALARKLVRPLRKQGMAWCGPAADLVQAGLQCAAGRPEQAIGLLRGAEEAFRASSTLGFAEATRRQRGVLLGGSEGEELVSASDEWFRGQAVANPERMADFLAPGFAREGE